MPDKHALLSPSGAERWLHCTRAPRLEADFPESTSDFAEEGRLAHEIAELRVRKCFSCMKPSEYNRKLKKLKENALYQEEMMHHTDVYIDYLRASAMQFSETPFVAVEQQLDISTFAPECFGTADCVMLGGGLLRIIDFKYGKGVAVNAEHNPQMMLYALGALELYARFYAIHRVVMTIVQPRLGSISEFEIARNDLVDWGVLAVKPKAALAFEGGGDLAPGDWCRFCRVKATCRARAQINTTAYEDFKGQLPPLLSDAEVGAALRKAQDMAKWKSNLEAYALKALLEGRQVDGWKAVEGRSNRQFTDQDRAFELLRDEGFDDAVLYERKPLALTAVEKLVGKQSFDKWMTGYIIKPPGKPTLAAESDSRPPYNPAAADFAGI